MNLAWYNIVGSIGVTVIVVTYILLQIGRIESRQLIYSVLNAVGAPAPTEVTYACGTERCARVLSPTDVEFRSSATSTTASNTDATKSASSSESTYNAGVDVNQTVNRTGPDIQQ